MRRPCGLTLLLVAPLLMASACGAGGGQRQGAAYTSSTTLTDWPTYHRTNTRSGHVARAPQGPLKRAWARNLPGKVYGEPLVVGSTLIVATERNYVYGLGARTGATRWRVHLGTPQPLNGLPCGNIDPLGITGTPAYSPGTGSVYVVAETTGGTHTLWALKATTGAKRWHRSLDTQPDRSKLAEQERAATLVTSGRVITTFGGLAGDCSNYVGYVTSVADDGQGAVRSYAVPTAREAGMWATPGAVRGTGRDVYVASGNGAKLDGTWDRSDSVTRLDPVTMAAKSVFAPSTWPDDNRRDLDLGSMSPAVVPAVDRLVIAGKRGTVYLLGPSFGGVGSQLRTLGGCTAFGAAAVAGQTVLMPCKGENSIRALHVGASSLRWSWSRHGVYSSPVIAGGKVFVADQTSGDLVVLRLSDGSVLSRHHAGPMPHFPSQIVSGDWVFVPTLDGVTAFRGR